VVASIHEALGKLDQFIKSLGISSFEGFVKKLKSLQNPVVVLPQGPGYILHTDTGHGHALVCRLKHFWLTMLTCIHSYTLIDLCIYMWAS
jgi:hypothetical protein